MKKISLNLSEKLLAEIDEEVRIADKEEKRSSFIRDAIREKIERRREDRKA